MKKLNLKLSLAAFCMTAAINVTAQGDPKPLVYVQILDDKDSYPCLLNSHPWYVGGNHISANNGSIHDAGTCNNFPFILKANNLPSVYITQSGKVGIGNNNSAPGAALDVLGYDPNDPAYGSPFRIYGDGDGNVEANNMNLDFNQSFNINAGTAQTKTNMFNIDMTTGTVGIPFSAGIGNIQSPLLGKLDVRDPNGANTFAYTTSTGNAGMWIKNDVVLPPVNSQPLASEYGMHVDVNGIGYITQDHNLGLNLIKFKFEPTYNHAQVWIGGVKPTGAHADFDFAVGGKMLAKSIFVTAATAWADYVFAADYKLPELAEVETYYKANKHLPEVPSAKEIADKGIDVGEMNTLLLKKVEELTLYVVEQQKAQQRLQKEVEALKATKK